MPFFAKGQAGRRFDIGPFSPVSLTHWYVNYAKLNSVMCVFK